MADFIDDTDEILSREAAKSVLGGKMSRQITSIEKKQDKADKDVFQIKQSLPKLDLVKSFKAISESQGKNSLGTKEITDLFKSLQSSVILETQSLTKSIMKQFLPIDVEVKRVIQLLTSTNEDARDSGLDRAEELEKAFGLDIKQIAQIMGTNIDKMINNAKFQKELISKENDVKEKIKEERLAQRDNLRQQGINTHLDEKTNTLRVLTFKQEQKFKEKIEINERYLQSQKIKINQEIDNLLKKDTLTRKQEKEVIEKKERLIKLEQNLTKKKEKAGINNNSSEEKVQGPIGTMFRDMKQSFVDTLSFPKEMFSSFKGLGGEISSLTKGITPLNKSFNFIGNSVKSLSNSFTGGISTFLKGMKFMGGGGSGGSLLGSAARLLTTPAALGTGAAIAGGLALGYGKRKLTNSLISDIERRKAIIEDKKSMDNDILNPSVDDSQKIKPMRDGIPLQKTSLPNADQFTDMNREFISPKEKSNVNNVIAPRNNISNINQSSTNVITPEISNFDRTYKNLNTILI
jgi:hypothetical protein